MLMLLKSVFAVIFIVSLICMCVAYATYAEPAGKDGKEEHLFLNTMWGIGLLMYFVVGLIAFLG